MANAATKKFQVDIATNPSVIIQTPEPTATNFPSMIPVLNIMTVTPIYFDFTSALPQQTIAVSGYTAAPNTITLPGAFGGDLPIGSTVTISGSTSNDGSYTVVSSTDDGVDTTITVVEPIVAAPVDGDVTFLPDSGTVENNESGDSFRETYPYKRMTRVILDLYDGQKLDWELQSISNQPTWSTGNRDGLNAALVDINALL